jgi:hypothetical protein
MQSLNKEVSHNIYLYVTSTVAKGSPDVTTRFLIKWHLALQGRLFLCLQ